MRITIRIVTAYLELQLVFVLNDLRIVQEVEEIQDDQASNGCIEKYKLVETI